jgi:hypothetical protein
MNKYSKKIKTPIYEITGERPKLSSLVDSTAVNKLLEQIDKAVIPVGVKSFLEVAATRHHKFNYQNIAEYYAHCSPEVQELFEQSALVIIDFDDAIANGFVQMNKRLMKIRDETS